MSLNKVLRALTFLLFTFSALSVVSTEWDIGNDDGGEMSPRSNFSYLKKGLNQYKQQIQKNLVVGTFKSQSKKGDTLHRK
jgi:hypothetical protein